MTDLTGIAHESLIRFYENTREQVSADARSGGKYRFMGEAAKGRANPLLAEIQRRGPEHHADLSAGLKLCDLPFVK